MSSASEPVFDPWCDEKNPRVVNFEQISAAAYRVRDGIVRTPCDVSKQPLPVATGRDVAGLTVYLSTFSSPTSIPVNTRNLRIQYAV